MVRLFNKLFGKKQEVSVESDTWITGQIKIKLPLKKEYSSSKARYIEFLIVKRSDKEKSVLQVSEVTEWGHKDEPNKHIQFEKLVTSEDLFRLGLSLTESAKAIKNINEAEKEE